MRNILNKKGQDAIGMSFSWIFSLVLIIFFVLAAIFGIKYFMNIGTCSRVGLFYDDLQTKIDEAYRSSSSNVEIDVNIPGIKTICFANLTEKITGPLADYEEISLYEVYNANTFLLPSTKACDMPYKNIKHLDINKTAMVKNPLCFDVSDGGKIRIVKGYYDKGVTIKK